MDRTRLMQIPPREFKKIGYKVTDQIAEFLDNIEQRPVTKGEDTMQLQDLIGNADLPEYGKSADKLLSRATEPYGFK